MHFLTTILPLTALATLVSSTGLNTSQEYYLQTVLKPDQPADKKSFAGLYLSSYHTGAGLSDAVFLASTTGAVKGFLNGPSQEYDLGASFPYSQINGFTSNVAPWQPVSINAGAAPQNAGPSSFSLNKNGLQWDNGATPEGNSFGGWLVCNWWYSAPQLFWRVGSTHKAPLCNCADVYLVPEYI